MYRCRSVPCPMGTARAEDPLGKVGFFTKLAEAVPMESGVFCRSDGIIPISIRIKESKIPNVTAQYTATAQYL